MTALAYQAGGVLAGRFDLTKSLGMGGAAKVWLAHDRVTDSDVAIKLPRREDDYCIQRILEEAAVERNFHHDGLVDTFGAGEDHGVPFIRMEYVEGVTLAQHFYRGPFSFAQIRDWGVQLASALNALHSRGMIHRDIKPGNVLVDDGQKLHICDFDLVCPLGYQHEGNKVKVTAGYGAPEQYRNLKLDGRCDIYAAGIVLYEAVTGQAAYDGDTEGYKVQCQLGRDPRPVLDLRPDTPPELAAVIHRAIHRDRKDRFQSAFELEYKLRGVTGI